MTVKLTPKQQKFCYKYIETGNASKAYRQSYDTENMKPATIKPESKASVRQRQDWGKNIRAASGPPKTP